MFDHNRAGTAYAFTAFTAILPGHEEAVRERIESLPRGPESPLARLDTLHYSRLQIFDELVYQGPPQKKRDRLKSSYLVFTASLDGDLDPFLDAIADRLPAEADGWWGHCVAYPGAANREAFKRWLKHNQVPNALFSSMYSTESVQAVRSALALRERVLEFATAAQGLEPAELQRRFHTELAGLV